MPAARVSREPRCSATCSTTGTPEENPRRRFFGDWASTPRILASLRRTVEARHRQRGSIAQRNGVWRPIRHRWLDSLSCRSPGRRQGVQIAKQSELPQSHSASGNPKTGQGSGDVASGGMPAVHEPAGQPWSRVESSDGRALTSRVDARILRRVIGSPQ